MELFDRSVKEIDNNFDEGDGSSEMEKLDEDVMGLEKMVERREKFWTGLSSTC